MYLRIFLFNKMHINFLSFIQAVVIKTIDIFFFVISSFLSNIYFYICSKNVLLCKLLEDKTKIIHKVLFNSVYVFDFFT